MPKDVSPTEASCDEFFIAVTQGGGAVFNYQGRARGAMLMASRKVPGPQSPLIILLNSSFVLGARRRPPCVYQVFHSSGPHNGSAVPESLAGAQRKLGVNRTRTAGWPQSTCECTAASEIGKAKL